MFRSCSNLRDLLKTVSSFEIASQKPLVTVNFYDSVETTLKAFLDSDVSSAPVRNERNQSIGFVDLIDLVSFLWVEVAQNRVGSQLTLDSLIFSSSMLSSQMVGTLTDFSKRNPFIFMANSSTVEDLLKVMKTESMARRGLPIHRVALVDMTTQRISSIVSQRDIIDFLAKNSSCLGKFASFPITMFSRVLKWPRRVISVEDRAKALEAFRIMHTEKISSVAVLNSNQILVYILTIQAMKGLSRDKLPQLFLPISEFIIQQATSLNQVIIPPATCPSNVSLEFLILKMASLKSQQIMLVDRFGSPTQMVSASDILSIIQIINEDPGFDPTFSPDEKFPEMYDIEKDFPKYPVKLE